MNVNLNREQVYYQLNDILECLDNRDISAAKDIVNNLIQQVR